eukprot:877821-Prorocentrum_minimum.AAC.2
MVLWADDYKFARRADMANRLEPVAYVNKETVLVLKVHRSLLVNVLPYRLFLRTCSHPPTGP